MHNELTSLSSVLVPRQPDPCPPPLFPSSPFGLLSANAFISSQPRPPPSWPNKVGAHLHASGRQDKNRKGSLQIYALY